MKVDADKIILEMVKARKEKMYSPRLEPDDKYGFIVGINEAIEIVKKEARNDYIGGR